MKPITNIKMTEKRTQILEVLKQSESPLTLAEISNRLGETVKPGTITPMIKVGMILVAGKRVIRCPVCGSKKSINEYKLPDQE